jgi:hypothetical protein
MQRRRRMDGTLDRMQELRLAIPQEVRDQYPDRDFRWFNDTGTRIHAKTQLDDWDKVSGVEPRTVGTDKEGKPMKAFLCMKPQEFVREDENRKEAERKEQERGLLRGDTNQGDLANRTHVPDGNMLGGVRN